MVYRMDDIVALAKSAPTMPKGMGNRELARSSESWGPYLRFLGAVMQTYKPKVALELGVYMATATRHMAVGSPESVIIGVDIDFHPAAFPNVKAHPNIHLIQGDSTDDSTVKKVTEALPGTMMLKTLIGLIFIDSAHDGDTPKREFEVYQPLFADECLVVCDDILDQRMGEFWEWLPGEKQVLHFLHPKLNDSYPLPGFGVSIVRREHA